MKTYTLIRDVPRSECNWLDRTVRKGETVYEFTGCTYGCIGSGEAVTFEAGENPFFELPANALAIVRPRPMLAIETRDDGIS